MSFSDFSADDDAVSRVCAYMSQRYPQTKRFSFDDAVHIAVESCGVRPAAVEEYLVSRCIRTASHRDLVSLVKFLTKGPVIEEVKICNQFKSTGTCTFGSRCLYHHVVLHGSPQMRHMRSYATEPVTRAPSVPSQLQMSLPHQTAPAASAPPPPPPPPSLRRAMTQLSSVANNFTALPSTAKTLPVATSEGHPESAEIPPQGSQSGSAAEPPPPPQRPAAPPGAVLDGCCLPPPPCLTFVVPALVDINGQFIRYLRMDEQYHPLQLSGIPQ